MQFLFFSSVPQKKTSITSVMTAIPVICFGYQVGLVSFSNVLSLAYLPLSNLPLSFPIKSLPNVLNMFTKQVPTMFSEKFTFVYPSLDLISTVWSCSVLLSKICSQAKMVEEG